MQVLPVAPMFVCPRCGSKSIRDNSAMMMQAGYRCDHCSFAFSPAWWWVARKFRGTNFAKMVPVVAMLNPNSLEAIWARRAMKPNDSKRARTRRTWAYPYEGENE